MARGDGIKKLERANQLAEMLNARLERMGRQLREPKTSPLQAARSADDDLYRARIRGR